MKSMNDEQRTALDGKKVADMDGDAKKVAVVTDGASGIGKCITEEFRKLGGALFAERRYGRVFFFHNGADSYYSVRGWRGFVCL